VRHDSGPFRPVPLKPAVDTLHTFGQSEQGAAQQPGGRFGAAAAPIAAPAWRPSGLAPRPLPLVTRQMISMQAQQERIRRLEAVSRLPSLVPIV
jgi:hypothetical protein